MLTNGNTKLGEKVWGFNLPRETCIDCRNKVCEEFCYAKAGNFLKPWVKASMEKNYNQSKKRNFVFKIINQIENEGIKFIRLHSSGDFYDKSYYNKWIKITKYLNTVKIIAYTRSIEIDLSKAPENFILYFSKGFKYENANEKIKENVTAERSLILLSGIEYQSTWRNILLMGYFVILNAINVNFVLIQR